MARPRMGSTPEIAVHGEKIEQLERSRDNLEESMGGILREMSEFRAEMAERLGKICAKLDKAPSSIPPKSDAPMKMGALIACITALAQVIVELAKAVIAAH